MPVEAPSAWGSGDDSLRCCPPAVSEPVGPRPFAAQIPHLRRRGEAVALRWEDVDLDGVPQSVWTLAAASSLSPAARAPSFTALRTVTRIHGLAAAHETTAATRCGQDQAPLLSQRTQPAPLSRLRAFVLSKGLHQLVGKVNGPSRLRRLRERGDQTDASYPVGGPPDLDSPSVLVARCVRRGVRGRPERLGAASAIC